MNTHKRVTIVPMPLIYFRGKILWGDYNLYSGAERAEVKDRANAGKQIPYAFSMALERDADILFVVDDKFNYERGQGQIIPEEQYQDFVNSDAIPYGYRKIVQEKKKCIVQPHPKVKIGAALGGVSFSERKLYEMGKKKFLIDGECAVEWTWLLNWIKEQGYTEIQAFIPKMCFKGICYATQMMVESGTVTIPTTITFTSNKEAPTDFHFAKEGVRSTL